MCSRPAAKITERLAPQMANTDRFIVQTYIKICNSQIKDRLGTRYVRAPARRAAATEDLLWELAPVLEHRGRMRHVLAACIICFSLGLKESTDFFA